MTTDVIEILPISGLETESPGVRLRPLEEGDGAAIAAGLAEREVVWMLPSIPHPYPDEGAGAFLARAREESARGATFAAVTLDGAFAGVASLTPHPSGGLELGYWIARPHWGRGVASAAAKALADRAFTVTTVPGLWARAAADNPASERVLVKLGFEPRGTLERYFASRRESVLNRVYWLDRLAWRGGKGRVTPQQDDLRVVTPRLVLDRLTLADVPAMATLANDRGVAEQTERIPYPYGIADAESFVAFATSADANERVFAVRLKDTGGLIGCTGWRPARGREVEIGYWLGRPFWGRGFGTEAVRGLIDAAFAVTDAHEIRAGARVTNSASRRVLEKCGFQWDGSGFLPSRALGGSVPVDRFRLDRRTWVSLTAWRLAEVKGAA